MPLVFPEQCPAALPGCRFQEGTASMTAFPVDAQPSLSSPPRGCPHAAPRMAVIGKPSFSLSILIFLAATISPVYRSIARKTWAQVTQDGKRGVLPTGHARLAPPVPFPPPSHARA